MRKILFFIISILISITAFSQVNLVPNPGFENGSHVPRCNTHYSNSNGSAWSDFDTDLYFWKVAQKNPSRCAILPSLCASPDWEDISCTTVLPSPPRPSDRWVRMASVSGSNREGIRVSLMKDGNQYKLIPGATYTLRLKGMPESGVDFTVMGVHFTKWSEHWNSDKNNNSKFMDAAWISFGPTYGNQSFHWYSVKKEITVPSSGYIDLQNMIFQGKEHVTAVDDIELYEGGCASDLLIENRVYNFFETPYQHNRITAGFDVGASTPNGDVVVQNIADVTYIGAQEVALKPGFRADAGSKFWAYIAPCGSLCPIPVANAGVDATICQPNQTYQIGMAPQYGINYKWIASPSSAIAYLSNPNISNPIFTAPGTGMGTIIYTLSAYNNCDQVLDNIVINYDVQPDPNPSVSISNFVGGDYFSFDLTVGTHTENVTIEVIDLANGSVVYTKMLSVGNDFTCCTFNWEIPDYLTNCKNYRIKVSAKNFCYPNLNTVYQDWTGRNTSITMVNLPNVFTPNGDGVNDQFCIKFTGAEYCDFLIQNRYGITVFTYAGAVSPDYMCLWDGTCNQAPTGCASNGTFVSDGVYYGRILLSRCGGGVSSYPVTLEVLGGHARKGNITEVENSSFENKKFDVYPNPSNGDITVEIPSSIIELSPQIVVYNLIGEEVFHEKINSNSEILSLKNHPKGMYLVKLILSNGYTEMIKIIYQ